uniref:Angiomotin C-terminal domain-containing protein n=1 Tax=Pygocentrus nattereri TaxID=42514 RepID=A0A3B4CMS4_PYGNA
MRSSEDGVSGTVLQRLMQEHLRYGTGGTVGGSENDSIIGVPHMLSPSNPVSTENLLLEEDGHLVPLCQPVPPQTQPRQEPQGQEHQGTLSVPGLGSLELPSYEEAKTQSQLFRGHQSQNDQQISAQSFIGVTPPRDEGLAELKEGHVRSLSERIMQLSLERNGAKQSRGPSILSPKETPETPENSPSPNNKSSKATAPPPPPPLPSIKTYLDHRGPPPEYPFKLKTHSIYPSSVSPGPQSLELSNEPSHTSSLIPHQVALSQYQPQSPLQLQCHPGQLVPGETFAMVSQTQQMLAILSEENQRLKQELLSQSEKAGKLQRLEAEVGRLSDAYESLVKSSSKRESLDKTMRIRLEGEIRRLHDFNRDLRGERDNTEIFCTLKEQEGLSHRRESIKEMERLEVEVETLRSGNEDQRHHIEILEQALNNAQSKVVRLEEELRKKQVYVERVERLQLALGQLQTACEKREQLEKRLRTRLERELEALRSQQVKHQDVSHAHPKVALLDLLREREERILGLEADMMRWEQKYLEESAMRQFAMEAAATAAAQRYTHDPLPLPHGNDNCLDLHAQLLEKDAMIKVLQQRSRRDSVPLRPARSTPSITIATGLHSRQTSHTERGELQSWKGSASKYTNTFENRKKKINK